ncbi:MAG: diacylglycerol kinase family protein [Caldilineaceae bacterium]
MSQSSAHQATLCGTDAETRNATLIYNPYAGHDDWQQQIEGVARFWCDHGWSVTLQTTQGPGHATELAASAAATGADVVISAGGDGTLHEVAQGLIHTPCILAPLPAGTTNCLTRDLGLPKSDSHDPNWLIESSQALLAGRVQSMDVGSCSNGKQWLLWAGVGIESRIVEHVEPRSALLKRFGLAGYVAKAAVPFLTFAGLPLRVAVDGHAIEGHFVSVTVCNSRVFAGGLLNLNPDGVLDDGQFETWVLAGRFAPRMGLHSLFVALQTHGQRPDVFCLRGRHIIIETATPQSFHLDGEVNHSTPITCTVLPGALRLLAPATAPDSLFSQPGEAL